VLDEPTNGLDPAGTQWLRSVLRAFADDGGTVLVSSHQLAEVAQTVDRILIIDGGRLLADAPLAELATGAQSLEERLPRHHEPVPAMNPQFRSELLKLRTTRTTIGMLGGMLAVALLATALHGLGLPADRLNWR